MGNCLGTEEPAARRKSSRSIAGLYIEEQLQMSPEELRDQWIDFQAGSSSKLLTITKKKKIPTPMTLQQFSHFVNSRFSSVSSDFTEDLIGMFDDESGEISFHEAAVMICVLEGTSPTEKLKFLFRVYDDNQDGILDGKEVEAVYSQMLTTSLSLGHDTKEMRPFFETLLSELDKDGDREISLEEWIQGGIGSVPLLELLGLGGNASGFNPYRIQEGEHEWRSKHFRAATMCNFCLESISGKHGMACILCNYTCHETCADKTKGAQYHGCRGTYVLESSEDMLPSHHWVDGNINCRCVACSNWIKSRGNMSGTTCSWCKATVHTDCVSDFTSECDLGTHRESMLPAISILAKPVEDSKSSDGGILKKEEDPVFEITPLPGTHPLVMFVNSKSGANQGAKVLRQLRNLLNPRQVFDLFDGGPEKALRMFAKCKNVAYVCCGGDGTIGWVLSGMDKLIEEGLYDRERLPPVGVIPLGTGNDLSRCLNWGGGFEGESIGKLIEKIQQADVVDLDRWLLSITPKNDEDETDAIPLSIVNNYFSIGVDASIALRFHHMRENHPGRFKSRMKNKLFYAQYGAAEALHKSCADLNKHIEVIVDGEKVKLPHLEGIAVLNIPSMYGGSNLWGTQKSKVYKPQHIGDGKIEVVGIFGSFHVGQIKGGLRQSAKRIAQGSKVEIITDHLYPMQTDGEPWMQSACKIELTHHSQVPFLRKGGKDGHQGLFNRSVAGGVVRASVVDKNRRPGSEVESAQDE